MKALNNTAIRIVVVLLVSLTAWLGTAHSQAPPVFNEEIWKQDAIYHSKGAQTLEGYTVDRSLEAYAQLLPAEFDRSLANLGPQDRWLDIGAGEAQAILDYYGPMYDWTHVQGRERRGKKARAVALSIEDRRTPLWKRTAARLEENQIRYLFSKRLREYSAKELGQFQLITDVVGGFSYSIDLTLFVEQTLRLLTVNGNFYTLLQDVHGEEGTNQPHYAGSPFLTEIANPDNSELKVCSWLKKISCVEVTCELKTGPVPPVEVYRIHKVCNNVAVPPLTTIHYTAGTPPERGYRVIHPSAPPPTQVGSSR